MELVRPQQKRLQEKVRLLSLWPVQKEKLARVGAQIANRDTLIYPIDITCYEQVQSMISQVVSVFGKIDILVNNAGVGMSAPVESMSLDNFRKLIEINVFAPLVLIQAVLPAMRNAQSGQSQHLLNDNKYRYKRKWWLQGNPRLSATLPWVSRSTRSTWYPILARPEASVTAVVVLPTPPFWFRIAKIVGIKPP